MIIETDGLKFVCDNRVEAMRAETLLTKEPGTIAWLNATLRPGDVFYDVGANIGCYALYAARLIGESGHVCAFEPHVGSATSLMRNIVANKLGDRITVFTCALHNVSGGFNDCLPFYYTSLLPGQSGSQLDHTFGEDGSRFKSVAIEMKTTATIHALISNGITHKPDIVKIDVDGNEEKILQGMFVPHYSYQYPREVQVETRLSNRETIDTVLRAVNYRLTHRHHTANGQRAISSGVAVETIPDNSVYERAA